MEMVFTLIVVYTATKTLVTNYRPLSVGSFDGILKLVIAFS